MSRHRPPRCPHFEQMQPLHPICCDGQSNHRLSNHSLSKHRLVHHHSLSNHRFVYHCLSNHRRPNQGQGLIQPYPTIG